MSTDATDRSRIEEELRDSQRGLELLAEVSRAFAEVSLDLEPLLTTITGKIASLIGDCCAVRLLTADGAHLTTRAIQHRDPALSDLLRSVFGDRESVNTGLSAAAIGTGRTIVVPEIPLDTLLAGYPGEAQRDLIRRMPVRAVMVAPLIARGIVLGTVATARTHDERPYTERDRQLLGDIADRAALAITTARHCDALHAARERLAVLAGASELLASSLDWETTLHNVIALAVPSLGDFGCFDVEDGDRARRLVHAPGDPDRQALLASTDLPPAALIAWPALGATAMLSVPLTAHGRRLGALTVFRGEGGGAYGDDDRALADELARRAAAALDNARLLREARDAIGVRDDFLAIAGHELRTPLTALQLQLFSVSKLLADGAPVDKVVDRAEKASRNAARFGVLVDELLDISRISAGRLALQATRFDLAEAVTETLARSSAELGRAGCRLELQVDQAVHGHWDRLRVEQIVGNLISNAIKYGKGKPVEVRVGGDRDRARLSVRDHGIGVSPEDQQRIFQRYERAVSSRHFGGLGLGLWIVRQLVEAHGGVIRVDSAPDAGAVFEVELPLQQAQAVVR